MNHLTTALLLAILAVGCATRESASEFPATLNDMSPSTDMSPNPIDPNWVVLRVGGDMEAQATFDAERGTWRAGSSLIDTALPVGYPPPTPPGAIDLKKYPAVRRAEFQSAGSRQNSAFWPLFRHIERNGIAMTSPVEYDYAGTASSNPAIRGWTMAFLYRTSDLGPTGSDPADARVTIRDTEEVTVLSLGGRGDYGTPRVERDLHTLYEWLAGNPEWEEAGPARALMYNGPTLFAGRKWLEVQVPVRRAESANP